MNVDKGELSGIRKPNIWLQAFAFCSALVLATAVVADEVFIAYIDDNGEEQTLTIDANSSDADNALAATLILEGFNIIVTLDEKEDLELIAAAVSAKAPDNATATAVSNTILGIGALLGGRSIVRSAEAPDAALPPVDTPPVSPEAPPAPPALSSSSSPPPPSSSVVSPN